MILNKYICPMENQQEERMMDIFQVQPNGSKTLIQRVSAAGEQKWRDFYEHKGMARTTLFEPVLTEADNKAFKDARAKLGFKQETQQPIKKPKTTKK